ADRGVGDPRLWRKGPLYRAGPRAVPGAGRVLCRRAMARRQGLSPYRRGALPQDRIAVDNRRRAPQPDQGGHPPSRAMTGKPPLYADLARQLEALIAGEDDLIANAANTAALIYHGLSGINWAGFYFARGRELVLGPFQGKPACVRIAWGAGVCGTAAASGASVVVPDVEE